MEDELTRRNFLIKAGAGIAGAALSFCLPSCTINKFNIKKLDRFTYYDMKSLTTYLKMGHCAPAVMDAILHFLDKKDDYMVQLSSGFPGGIGGLGYECGGITSSIMVLGMELGYNYNQREVPNIIKYGLLNIKKFKEKNQYIICSKIQNNGINACKNVIATAPKICLYCTRVDDPFIKIEIQSNKAYINILNYFQNNSFHCTHSVLYNLSNIIDINDKILRVSWGFVGGTLLQGLTCGALTAGVLAIGTKFGASKDKFSRVMKLMRMMKKNEDYNKENLNNFHKAMMISKDFGKWFEKEFGSSQCKEITQCNFSSCDDIDNYISNKKLNNCRKIVSKVSEKIEEILI